MFTPATRVLLILGCQVLGIYFYHDGMPIGMYGMCVTILLIFLGYFLEGTVFLAWRKLTKQDFASAERIISMTHFPKLLRKGHRGYYHFIRGLVSAHKQDVEGAYDHLQSALKCGVRTEYNIALIKLNLAEIELERGRISEAKNYLMEVRSLKYRDELEPEIRRIEERIKSAS